MKYAIESFNTISKDLEDEIKKVVLIRRDTFLFFMLVRSLRFNKTDEIKANIEWAKTLDIYPIKKFPYSGISMKYKILNKQTVPDSNFK